MKERVSQRESKELSDRSGTNSEFRFVHVKREIWNSDGLKGIHHAYMFIQ